ncbi:arginyl-tRNA synthetase [Rhodoglobus sp. NPDC076762]
MAFRLRVLPAVIALSASALLLSACVPTEPEPELSSPTPTRSVEPTTTATAAPEPTTPSTPDAQATPVSIACGDLITPQAMYDFNPNFLLLNSFTPAAGSAAATAIESQGVACRWENTSSGITIDVSVAKPAPGKLESLKSNAGPAASSFDGYFAASGGTGTAQLFSGEYWAALSSAAFFEAGDASTLVADVQAALN